MLIKKIIRSQYKLPVFFDRELEADLDSFIQQAIGDDLFQVDAFQTLFQIFFRFCGDRNHEVVIFSQLLL